MKISLYTLIAQAVIKYNSNIFLDVEEIKRTRLIEYLIILKEEFLYNKNLGDTPIFLLEYCHINKLMLYNATFYYHIEIAPSYTLLKEITVKIIKKKQTSLDDKQLEKARKFYYKQLTKKIDIKKLTKRIKSIGYSK